MLTLADGYARLVLQKDDPFTGVTESVRSLLQVCRLNQLPAALIVSHQVGFDFRSSVRIALKFGATRPGGLPRLRLGVVAAGADDGMLQSVVDVAQECGLVCRGFRDEAEATTWLARKAEPG